MHPKAPWMTAALCVVSGLCAYGQSGKATVSADKLPVHSRPRDGSSVIAQLSRGDAVSVALRITGSDGVTWCLVTYGSKRGVFGYAICSDLAEETPTPAAAVTPQASATQTAAPNPAVRDAEIQRLLKMSGIERQYLDILDPAVLAKMIAERGATRADPQQITRIMQQALTPETFLKPIRDQLRATYSEDVVQYILRWYSTPVAERVTQAEARSSTPDNAQRFAAFYNDLRTHPPPPERLALVQRMDSMMDLSEMPIKAARIVVSGIAKRLNPSLPEKDRLTDARLQSLMQELDQNRPMIKNLSIARLLYAYNSVSTEDLSGYMAFLESQPGQWLWRNYMQASTVGLESAAGAIGDAILQTMPQTRKR